MVTERKKPLEVITDILPPRIGDALYHALPIVEHNLQDITIRSGRPICLYQPNRLRYLCRDGRLSDLPDDQDVLSASPGDLSDTVMKICAYSIYSRQEEINRGYLTISGGARVGLCGSAVSKEGSIGNVKSISSLNIRVPREVVGCSNELLSLISPLRGVLLCGAPGSGKTTVLRDMSRTLSYRFRISLIDERGELSAVHDGSSCFDVGLCDIYDGYPKHDAMIAAVRSMSPDIIVCDELGDREDIRALRYMMRCGVAVIASIHAGSPEDLMMRERELDILSSGAFRYLVFLSGRDLPGKVEKIYEWGV